MRIKAWLLVGAFANFSGVAMACQVSFSSPIPVTDGVTYQAEFSSTAGAAFTTAELEHFRQNVRNRVDVDPYSLIQRQRGFFRAIPRLLKAYDLILQRKVGRILPIACVEQSLLVRHLSLASAQTEFSAWILTHPQNPQVIALVKSANQAGVSMRDMEGILRQRQKSGWRLQTQLHNHPFDFTNPHGDVGGVTFPSEADVNYGREQVRDWGLSQLSITNGFDTLVLDATELSRL